MEKPQCFNWDSKMRVAFPSTFNIDGQEEECKPLDIKKGVDVPCDKKWHKVKLGYCIPRSTPDDIAERPHLAGLPHMFGHSWVPQGGGRWMVREHPGGKWEYGPWPPKGYETQMGAPGSAPVPIQHEAAATSPGGMRTDAQGNQLYMSWVELRARLFHKAMMADPETKAHIKKMKDAIRCNLKECKKEFKKVADESPNLWKNDDIFIYDSLMKDGVNANTLMRNPVSAAYSYVGVCLIVKVRCSPKRGVPTGGNGEGDVATPTVDDPLKKWWTLSDEQLARLLKARGLEWMSKGDLELRYPLPRDYAREKLRKQREEKSDDGEPDSSDESDGAQDSEGSDSGQVRWLQAGHAWAVGSGQSSVVQTDVVGAVLDHGTSDVHRVLDRGAFCACPQQEVSRAASAALGHTVISSSVRSGWLAEWKGASDVYSDCCSLAISA